VVVDAIDQLVNDCTECDDDSVSKEKLRHCILLGA
jgi:hypothetical protein